MIDTNIWISAYSHPDGAPGKSVQFALENYTVSHSPETWGELKEVLSRPEFNRIAPLDERLLFANSVAASGQFLQPAYEFDACRDPKDNKFLSLAYAAGADCIVTGDEKHLQPMKHFMGVQIWSPEQFIARELTQELKRREHEKAYEPGKRLSAKDMADQLMGGSRELVRAKQPEPTPAPKIDTSPSIWPDYGKGMELRRKKPTGEDAD